MYWIANDTAEKDCICPKCGHHTKWNYTTHCYNTFCSRECAKDTAIKNALNTIQSKYGSKCALNNKYVKAKRTKTWNRKYGGNPNKCGQVRSKIQNTCLERYGDTCNFGRNSNISYKSKATCLIKYGTDNPAKVQQFIVKSKRTKFLKYGDPDYNNSQGRKRTCLQRYGSAAPAGNKEIASKISATLKAVGCDKGIETKRVNNTLNSSNPEKQVLELLCTRYKNVKVQYKTDLYPWHCDFYIPRTKTYIELNFHWTHGSEPYNSRSKLHKQKLADWKQKSLKSKFYSTAIYVWTRLDVRKRKCAKTNNLKYYEFYSMQQFLNFFYRRN